MKMKTLKKIKIKKMKITMIMIIMNNKKKKIT